jgi:HEPN domain-containing protein
VHARHAIEDGDFEWSCFAAQQAAVKCVKAVYECLRGEGWDHVISRLLRDLPPELEVNEGLEEAALRLDKLYVPTRYPNGFAWGAPGYFYTTADGEAAIRDAARIFEFCRRRCKASL